MVSLASIGLNAVRLALLALFGWWAYSIRLHAIETYGM